MNTHFHETQRISLKVIYKIRSRREVVADGMQNHDFQKLFYLLPATAGKHELILA